MSSKPEGGAVAAAGAAEIESLPILDIRDVPELTNDHRAKLWDAVIAAIRAENRRHYAQDSWTGDYVNVHGAGYAVFAGHCGTRACIAGHALHEAAELKLMPPCKLKLMTGSSLITEAAERLLGLNRVAAHLLFDESAKPGDSFDTIDEVLEEVKLRQAAGASLESISDWLDTVLEFHEVPDPEDYDC